MSYHYITSTYNHSYALILRMLRTANYLKLHNLRHARINSVAAGINLWLAQRKVKEEWERIKA